MPLKDVIRITISALSSGVTQAGFGIPLILSHNAAWVERTRSYTSADAVLTDFPTVSTVQTPEYRAAVKLFSQDPAPEKVIIGRAVGKPTQKFTITVSSVANTTAYAIRIGAETASFTSDSSATNDEVVAGLLAAFNALSGHDMTATQTGSVGSKVLVLTGDVAGNWHDVEIVDVSLLSIAQDHADPGVATDLTAIKNANDEWYALFTLYNSKLYVKAAADWIETQDKLYVAQSQDTQIIDVAVGSAADIATALKTATYFRTGIIYHPATGAFADGAWEGACLPLSPGSETWKFKTLATVPATVVSATHQTNLEAKHCNYYYNVANENMTTQGVVAAGEFIDVIRFRDWLKARMSERLFARLKNAKKIAFTDAGFVIVENEIRGVLSDGVKVGGLSNDPAPTVTVPKASAVPTADRTARKLTGFKFKATLAGAIHLIDPIEGDISV